MKNKGLSVLVAIFHGLLIAVNILLGVLINNRFPVVDPAKQVGAGDSFGLLTCLATVISFVCFLCLENERVHYQDKLIATMLQASLLGGIIVSWIYWIPLLLV